MSEPYRIDVSKPEPDTISQLQGDGWTVPWALVADEHTGQVYIRGDYTWRPDQFGTSDLHVRREDDGHIHIIGDPPPRICRGDVDQRWAAEPVYIDA